MQEMKYQQDCWKEQESGATNKLSGHNTADIIQNLEATADRDQKATRSTASVTAAPTVKADDLDSKTRSLSVQGKRIFAGSLYIICYHCWRKNDPILPCFANFTLEHLIIVFSLQTPTKT